MDQKQCTACRLWEFDIQNIQGLSLCRRCAIVHQKSCIAIAEETLKNTKDRISLYKQKLTELEGTSYTWETQLLDALEGVGVNTLTFDTPHHTPEYIQEANDSMNEFSNHFLSQ